MSLRRVAGTNGTDTTAPRMALSFRLGFSMSARFLDGSTAGGRGAGNPITVAGPGVLPRQSVTLSIWNVCTVLAPNAHEKLVPDRYVSAWYAYASPPSIWVAHRSTRP